MKLYVNHLESAFANELLSPKIRKASHIFLEAMNDWPTEVSNLDDYAIEVKKYLGGVVNKETVSNATKNSNFSRSAWPAESLAQLEPIFDYYGPNATLEDIIIDLKIKLQ